MFSLTAGCLINLILHTSGRAVSALASSCCEHPASPRHSCPTPRPWLPQSSLGVKMCKMTRDQQRKELHLARPGCQQAAVVKENRLRKLLSEMWQLRTQAQMQIMQFAPNSTTEAMIKKLKGHMQATAGSLSCKRASSCTVPYSWAANSQQIWGPQHVSLHLRPPTHLAFEMMRWDNT